MRRFSQKNQLVTLNEINVTPLLDLAFVLLIIFVITRPLLEQSVNLKVPGVGPLNPPTQVARRDLRVVEIEANGATKFRGRAINPAQLDQAILAEFRQNPKIVVQIRADKHSAWDHVAKTLTLCSKNGIAVSYQTVE
jgi:biopolymer transport protein ExbD